MRIGKRLIAIKLLCISYIFSYAQPGKDGSYTVTSANQIINKYAMLSANIAAGDNTLSLVAGPSFSLCSGDLVMVYQAQGASINTTLNTNQYGNINAYNSAGLYEFKYVQAISGNVITFQTVFTNSYSVLGRTQIIKVPQYSNLVINAGASITAKKWKDTTISTIVRRFGGIVAIHASNITNNGTITASGMGFRGGAYTDAAGTGITSYISMSASDGGEKGEGIFGYQTEYSANGGRYCRGAPANGGGGGDAHNAGGGGGANGFNGNVWSGEGVMVVDPNNPITAWALDPAYISNGNNLTNSSGGGRGGYSWGSFNANATINGPGNPIWNSPITGGDSRRQVGGLGGRPLTNINSESRIYFGGGGGAANANNTASFGGADGGGIIYLVATNSIGGTGTIESNGNTSGNTFYCNCDGASGGGAGGSIVIKTTSIPNSQSVSVIGGKGGDQLAILTLVSGNYASTIDENDGPGGGGGGGFVAISAGAITPNINAGVNGQSLSQAVTEFPFNGATRGALGQIGAVTNTFIAYLVAYTTPSILCQGESLSLVSPSVGLSYQWTGPNSFTSSVQHPTLTSTTPVMSGTYTLFVELSSGCKEMVQTQVTVNPTPTLSLANATLCNTSSVNLFVIGATQYTWQPGNLTGSLITVSPNITTNYTVVGDLNGCLETLSNTVLVHPLPIVSFNTFSINCANLGSATVNTSGGGGGPYTYSWQPTSQTNSVVTGLFPGNYTVQVFDAFTGCQKDSVVNFAPLVPLTGTVSSTNSVQCYGSTTATANIVLSGGSGNQSYQWISNNGTLGANPVSGLAPGVNTINVVDALTFCSLTQTFFITQPSAVIVNIASSSPSVCIGGNINLTASATGGTSGYTFTWQPSNTVSSNYLSIETTAGSYTYQATATDANSCLASRVVTLSYVANPTISVTDASICPLQQASLVAIGATNYTWNTGQTGSSLIVAPTITSNYTVLGSAFSCTSSTTASVIIKQTPTVSITSNAPVCAGTSLQLLSQASTTNILWKGPDSFTSNINHPIIQPVTMANNGVYTLIVTAPNNCTASVSSNFTVNPIPLVSVSSGTVCQHQPLMISAGNLSGANYQWTGPNNFISTVASNTLPNASIGMIGSYSLLITSASNCTNVLLTTASVVTKPVITLSSNNPVCVGDNLIFSANGATSYTWNGVNSYISAVSSNTIQNVTTNATGVYSVFTTFGPCLVDSSLTLTVNPLPVPSIIGNATICEQESLTLVGSGGINYQWKGPDSFSFTGISLVLSPVSFTNAGTYSLEVIDANSCKSTTTTTILVLNKPKVAFVSDTVCFGEPANLSAGGGISYLWFGPSGFTSTLQTLHIDSVKVWQAGNYSVVVTGANTCTSLTEVPLIGNDYPLPVPEILIPTKICVGSQVELKGSGGISYDWKGPNGYRSTIQNAGLNVTGTHIAGIYTLSVKNASNCSATRTIEVKTLSQPQATINSNMNKFCAPFCASLSIKTEKDTTKAPITKITYSVDTSRLDTISYNHCFLKGGVYSVKAIFTDTNGCSASSLLQIEALEKPQANFVFSPSFPLADKEKVNFYNTSTGDFQTEWQWFFVGLADTIKTERLDYLFKDAGSYPIALKVKNKWGCYDTIVRTIVVDDEILLFVPNAFSPNGDRINDLFEPKGVGILKYRLRVFDRWGEMIFEANDMNTLWDGTYKGKPCTDDIYLWKIDYSSRRNNFSKIGDVMLLQN